MTIALWAAATLSALAPISEPPREGRDPHLKAVLYQANQVIPLVGHLGFQTTIQLEPGERIENVAIGDSALWQITPNKRADLLFIKPIGPGRATNMVLVTNLRTYTFALSIAPTRTPDANATWVLKFILPPPMPQFTVVAEPAIAKVTAVGKNASYTVTGAAELLPSRVFDDGTATYFYWPEEVSMPAIFAVNPDGTEAIVNFVIRDGYVMVQQTAGRFILRRGASIATVTSTPGVEKRLPQAGKR